MDRATRNAPYLILGALLLASGILTLALTAELTFFQDTWGILMERRDLGVDTILAPHNEHIVVALTLIEVGLVDVFGMSSALPEYIVFTISLLAVAALLFVYVQRRVGPWLALMATAMVLFLGPAWQAILWPFEIVFSGSLAAGLGMLLALERRDRRGDLAACALLAVSLSFSMLGVAFAVAAAVQILLDRGRLPLLRRAYVVAVPLALFAVWYVGWGSDAESFLSLRNVMSSPRYVVEALAIALGSLLGLGTNPFGPLEALDKTWGIALLIAAALALAASQLRRPGFSPGLWPVAAAATTNWLLTAFNYIPARDPSASRYQYVGGVFVVLIAANLLRDVRFGRRALLVCGAIALGAISSNLVVLKAGQEWLRDESVLTRADTAAIEIARDGIKPSFRLTPELAGTPSLINIEADKYLDAVDEHGSPAYTPTELEAAPAAGRRQADIILGQALPLSTVTTIGPVRRRGECALADPAAPGGFPLAPGTTTIAVESGPPAEFNLARFAEDEFPVATEGAPGGSTTELTIPADRSERPWRLQVLAEQPVHVCTSPPR